MNRPRRNRRGDGNDPTLAFDVTQDIDPALVDPLRGSNEPTLTQVDFDELTVELPKPPKPQR